LTVSAMHRRLATPGDQVGLSGLSAHVLRHTIAKNLMDAVVGDDLLVQPVSACRELLAEQAQAAVGGKEGQPQWAEAVIKGGRWAIFTHYVG